MREIRSTALDAISLLRLKDVSLKIELQGQERSRKSTRPLPSFSRTILRHSCLTQILTHPVAILFRFEEPSLQRWMAHRFSLAA
jgi:hypothetical protein